MQDHVVLLGLGHLLDDLVGTLQNLRQLFVLAGAQVFLEFTALALEVAVLVHQLALARGTLALGHGGCFAFKLVAGGLQGVAHVHQFLLAAGELLLQLGLRSLGCGGFPEDAIGVDETGFELLRLCRDCDGKGAEQQGHGEMARKGFH